MIRRSFIFLSMLCCVAALELSAQPAFLDPAFGTGGLAVSAYDRVTSSRAMVAIPGGGYYVVGRTTDQSADARLGLMKYLADGSADMTFGTNGRATFLYGNLQNIVSDVALQPDGKVLVCGCYQTVGTWFFFVRRYNTDGTPDLSFNSTGSAQRSAETTNACFAGGVVAQPDGKILMTGIRGSGRFMVVRFNADGSPDTDFGNLPSAHYTYLGGAGLTSPGHVVVLPDGKILMSGDAQVNGEQSIFLLRLSADGDPDPTFGTDGVVGHTFNSYGPNGSGLVLLPGGKVVLTGIVPNDQGVGDVLLARFDADGQLDGSFGTNGYTLVGFDSTSTSGYDLAMLADSSWIVAGRSSPSIGCELYHFTADGQWNSGFGTDGRLITNYPVGDPLDVRSVEVDDEQRVVVVNDLDLGDSTVVILARFYQGNTGIPLTPLGADPTAPHVAPDPVVPTSTVRFTLPIATKVSFTVVDALGRQVATRGPYLLPAGTHHEELPPLQGLSVGRYTLISSIGEQRRSVPFVKTAF